MSEMSFIGGMFEGKARADAALARGDKFRVFDWDKAARLIRERKPSVVEAGLEGDWNCTGGQIFSGGKPDTDSYTYLASVWATPQIELDGEREDCWVYEDDSGWDSSTKWPESALAILRGEEPPAPAPEAT